MRRLAGKRSLWDDTDQELIDLYDHLAEICRKAKNHGDTPSLAQWITATKHPLSSLNFLNDQQVPIHVLTQFRTRVASKFS